ncbi:hypothetical protein HSIEG1_2115 [Enterococcus sp. HSIEG1]|nr:hypothetical protein HSIEG1_2115 [Enterococcus sp. HSIEG1]OJG51217.1 hypothetical protein RV03_GL000113 [Enterococcus gallinarum]
MIDVGLREGKPSEQKVVTRVIVLLSADAGKRTFFVFIDL